MKITIKVIPQSEQRYLTVGDWWWDKDIPDKLHITVSDLGDKRMSLLVAVHELIEAILCDYHGVKTEDVDKFDLEHLEEEPGDNPLAPYHEEHTFASSIERMLAQALDVEWAEYNQVVENSLEPSASGPGISGT